MKSHDATLLYISEKLHCLQCVGEGRVYMECWCGIILPVCAAEQLQQQKVPHIFCQTYKTWPWESGVVLLVVEAIIACFNSCTKTSIDWSNGCFCFCHWCFCLLHDLINWSIDWLMLADLMTRSIDWYLLVFDCAIGHLWFEVGRLIAWSNNQSIDRSIDQSIDLYDWSTSWSS